MEQKQPRNILVTGGNGFIGWNFLKYLFEKNELRFNTVINVDSCDYSSINKFKCEDSRYRFYKGRMGEIGETLIEAYKIDLIVNFAAHTHVDNSIKGIKDFVINNILEMSILLESAKNYWKKENIQGLFLQVSTDEVFGSVEDQGGPFNEFSLMCPNNPYSATKASAELILRSYMHTHGVRAIITNCSNNYGAGQHEEKLIPKIIKNCLAKKSIPLYGDGLQKRDWIYVDDHCEGIISAINHGIVGNSYLFGTNKTITNKEIVYKICNLVRKETGEDFDYSQLITHVEDRLGHDRTYKIDYARSLADLSWSPKTELDFGLEKTVKWYLNKSV